MQLMSWLDHRSQRSSSTYSEKPLVMGILNVTPDSFFDGGKFFSMDKAYEHACHLINHGADLIDIGGESTRPGAIPVSVDTELERTIPVIQYIRAHSDICISIDTHKPEVMETAVQEGANMINDVYALRTPGALEMAAKLGVPVCLMHMQGKPENMQQAPYYPNGILTEVMYFFKERIENCVNAGMDKKNLILDPGFGFGKQTEDNLYLIKMLEDFLVLELPLLLGVSRKSTIGKILNKEVQDRLPGSIALAVYAALKGVGIIRTHDVDETNQALIMIEQVFQANSFNKKGEKG
jgi:dihydropteroate synthase